MKMRHNTLSTIAENPFLTENDRNLIIDIYNQNVELHTDLAELRKEIKEVCKNVTETVKKLNQKQ